MKKNAENLLETSVANQPQISSGKPQGLPDKFYDATTGQVKLEELIQAYNDLAMRDDNLIEGNLRNIPNSYEDYEITISSPYLERDDEVLKRMFEKRFTNEQAQLVYDLANERVLPYIEEMTVNFEAARQIEKLVAYFGGQERFNEVSRQISSWAKQNVNPKVYEALASTSEGVVALYQMMSSKEPVLSKESGNMQPLNEETLRRMMEDPRYWRDHDKEYVARITRGFEKLYPSK